jgi:hypothetical protein
MVHEHFEVGDWVKYKAHNRFGRVTAVTTCDWPRRVYGLTYGHDDKERSFTWYDMKRGEQTVTVDRPTLRHGVYVMVEQKWAGNRTEKVEPTERRFQTWALAKMRS